MWPEVERYSRLQDALETAANYGTYITTGGGPDFSIGLFQMKPSFVEEMEKAWMRSGLAREYELWFDTADNATARRIRISRLQKEEWQVIYVGVFLRLLYASYGSFNKKGERTQEGIETLPLKEQVRLAATAYNRGVVWAAPGYGDLDRLRVHASKNTSTTPSSPRPALSATVTPPWPGSTIKRFPDELPSRYFDRFCALRRFLCRGANNW